MAKAQRTKATPETKELKLVCKCGDCTHWEIILVKALKGGRGSDDELIKCTSCGTTFSVMFATDAHEGLHYEKHVPGEEKSVRKG